MISFIVPIYNAAKYLEACIRSLQDQTERDIQILLVDDGSTDDSLTIARRYAAKDARITVLEQVHAGQSAARNLALHQAIGDYIAFVDADDRLESDWCTKHLASIDGVDYVQSGYKRVSIQGEILEEKAPKRCHQFTSPCMRLYHKETLRDMTFAEGYIYEDVLFSTDLWLRKVPCRIIPYTGYLYTLTPGSTTSTAHPEAQQRLFGTLRAKARQANLRGKCIILYTILRLRAHYLLG